MKSFIPLLKGSLFVFAVLVLLINVLPTSRVLASVPHQNENTNCSTGRSISVSGAAVVNVVPDRALIQLGVESNAKTPTAVQAMNTLAIRRVIDELNNMGIESKYIATDRYVVHPVYDDYSSLTIKGYRINNIVAVTLQDVDLLSKVVITSLEAGANEVIDVELYTSELRKYRDQARQLAMQAASEKAQALANAAGADTGCVLNINENSWSYYNGWWYGRNNVNLWAQNVIQNAGPSGGESLPTNEDGPLSLGQISVRAEVNATYSLK